MRAWVREKLKQINELYPPDRLRASKARWRAIWAGEQPQDRYPYLFFPASFNYCNDNYTKEDGLAAYLDEFICRGFIGDDFIPAFFPGCRQGAIPGMLGAEEIVVGRDHTNKRMIFCPADIDSLPRPDITHGASAKLYLEMQRYWIEECEGAIPVHVCDMQGPLDAAAQMYGYDNLFLLAYDDKPRFDKFMVLVSEAFCMLWEAQKENLGTNFIGTHLYGWDWIPPGGGATLSADCMAMFSGEFFEEFYRPHLERIASRLGPISVHSCGDFSAVAVALGAVPCIRAVNASQMTVEQLLDAGWPSEKAIILMEAIERADIVFDLARKKNLRLDVTFFGLWPQDASGNIRHPSTWSNEDKSRILKAADQVERFARR